MSDEAQEEADQPFAFVPGYYFALMGYLSIPHGNSMHGHGGNLTILLYRKDSTPTRWYMKFRFRHYFTNKPDDDRDTRNWNLATFNEDEALAVKKAHIWLETMGALTGHKPDFLEIKGDCEKFFGLQKPSWLRMSIVAEE